MNAVSKTRNSGGFRTKVISWTTQITHSATGLTRIILVKKPAWIRPVHARKRRN